ncbi:MAG TPA: type II toxin-antitoxin system RelE/ParE family toxin [Firmicutes bacterium]|nr:type II toxin-antitoxin system RelE/ParE family toxin [Bacillota bacterium]
MGKIQELEKLKKLFENVNIHPDLLMDLHELVIGTGFEKDFFYLLTSKLNILCQLKHDATYRTDFEKLDGAPGLYSIKLKSSRFNIRIIYSYIKNGEILLHGFYERKGKRKTEYQSHIQISQQRFKGLKGSE